MDVELGLPPDGDFTGHIVNDPDAPAKVAEEATPAVSEAVSAAPEPIIPAQAEGQAEAPAVPAVEETVQDETEKARNAKFAEMRIAKRDAEREAARQREVASESARRLAEIETRIAEAEVNSEDVPLTDLVSREMAEREIDQANNGVERSHQAIENAFQTIRNDFFTHAQSAHIKAQFPDFDQAIKAEGLENPVIANEIFNSPMGHDVAYYLGKNPEILRNIANQTPDQIVREMMRVEIRLEEGKKRSKTQSSAPTPINPLRGGGGNLIPDDGDLSIGQIAAKMREYDKTHY